MHVAIQNSFMSYHEKKIYYNAAQTQTQQDYSSPGHHSIICLFEHFCSWLDLHAETLFASTLHLFYQVNVLCTQAPVATIGGGVARSFALRHVHDCAHSVRVSRRVRVNIMLWSRKTILAWRRYRTCVRVCSLQPGWCDLAEKNDRIAWSRRLRLQWMCWRCVH